MPKSKAAGLTRRQMLKVGGTATFAGYAVGVEKALGQAIKTDTQGITAGDARSRSAATRCRSTRHAPPAPPMLPSSS